MLVKKDLERMSLALKYQSIRRFISGTGINIISRKVYFLQLHQLQISLKFYFRYILNYRHIGSKRLHQTNIAL